MSHRWAPNFWMLKVSRAVKLWQTPVHNSSGSRLRLDQFGFYVPQPDSYKVDYLSWKYIHHMRIRGQKGWHCRANQVRQRLTLHTSTLCLKTSASLWTAGLNHHMSRVRNTLDTVSKAVSRTHTEFLSRISRFKRKSFQTHKNVGEGKAEESEITSGPPAPHSTSNTPISVLESTIASKSASSSHKHAATVDASSNTSVKPQNFLQESEEPKEKKLAHVASQKSEEPQVPLCNIKKRSTTLEPSTELFHPTTFTVNLNETYNYLAHHINTYFDSLTKTPEMKVNNANNCSASTQDQETIDLTPASDKTDPASLDTQTTPKKGLGHYLSYSGPSVQAFVGSYIAPLVPKFKTSESKYSAVEEQSEDVPMKQGDITVSKEQKVAEEKARRLLLQREKIIARVSVDNRTRALVHALHRASDVRVYISRVEDLSYHLLEFPESRGVAVKEKAVPCLLRLRQADDPGLQAAVREALTVVGYHTPVKGRGIRILSIDGGGLRGLVALQTLQKLEALTGAVLGFLLGMFQMPLSECVDLYRKLGSDVFKQNVIVGTVKMSWSHAFYDSETWENLLKEKMGSNLMVETSRNPKCPKVAAVSTVVNRGTPLKAYVFRNYNLLPSVGSHYMGGCQHQLWQAIRATSAAPGYFQEFTLGNDVHQEELISSPEVASRDVKMKQLREDGGLLINNPTALAIHECHCLWPNTPLECVVSLGTGRFEATSKQSTTYTSLKAKLTNVISSATDTEEVHTMLDAFLPSDTYFRFNPYINEEIALDESRQEKLNMLQAECIRYLERNEEKLKKVACILNRDKGSMQKVAEWARLRADMYNSLPFSSSKL
ncbi:calcium-independent phospholipase A2-gamma-like isoform X2 [Thalassophryne amazonica]|uniref:calcium-independent phospholipase A2-gamma-like isoform X2 n=1 Tax=Thalassophryne amazonica TaxID=390379 RepID=UPI001471F9E6|nr:calcium-independent phospholipase A2-gamma-like isoform X2 [Thalassophryne amazonica]